MLKSAYSGGVPLKRPAEDYHFEYQPLTVSTDAIKVAPWLKNYEVFLSENIITLEGSNYAQILFVSRKDTKANIDNTLALFAGWVKPFVVQTEKTSSFSMLLDLKKGHKYKKVKDVTLGVQK